MGNTSERPFQSVLCNSQKKLPTSIKFWGSAPLITLMATSAGMGKNASNWDGSDQPKLCGLLLKFDPCPAYDAVINHIFSWGHNTFSHPLLLIAWEYGFHSRVMSRPYESKRSTIYPNLCTLIPAFGVGYGWIISIFHHCTLSFELCSPSNIQFESNQGSVHYKQLPYGQTF